MNCVVTNITKEDILNRLNEEQKKPVLDYLGPQFIVAGPGSGKTFTIVSRSQYMLMEGIKPENMLLFTFTNKAAREIKERIANAVGAEVASKITMGTYHSFCCRLLRQYGTALGYKNGFSIYDAEDSKKMLKKIIKGTDIEYNALASYISHQKRKLISPTLALENSIANKDPYANYYKAYQDKLYEQNSMDFDDLIYNTIKLLELNPDILEKVNNRYQYISADESHDSSNADIRLIYLLSGEKQNVCFILDDNQSIYGIRGADIEAVLNIKNLYPNLKEFYLNQNYRSSGTIVGASKSLIKHNAHQLEKQIFTENPPGNKIIVFEEADPKFEAVRIAKTIKLLTTKYKLKPKDIAILYRTSSQSRTVEEILLRYQIPYEILSGINFYARKEVKDVLAFVKFLVNPYDLESFTRIINIPKRGIGDKSIEKIIDESKHSIPPVDLLTACERSITESNLRGKAKAGVEQFCTTIEYLKGRMNDLTVPELITEIVKMSNYYQHLEEDCPEDFDDKTSNIIELIELSYEFNTLEEFLEQTSLDRKEEDESDENSDGKVKLLTMHMSKGLEWPAVFCIGINEGTNPHFRSLGDSKAIDEERRLFYVAMTRAKYYLFLTRPKRVQMNGFFTNAKPSRFLSEIDEKFIHTHNPK